MTSIDHHMSESSGGEEPQQQQPEQQPTAAATTTTTTEPTGGGDEYVQQYIAQADATKLKNLAIQLRDECHRRGLAWISVQAPD